MLLQEDLGESGDGAQRGVQVVGDGVGERVVLAGGRLQVGGTLAHALLEIGDQPADLVLCAHQVGDVGGDAADCVGASVGVGDRVAHGEVGVRTVDLVDGLLGLHRGTLCQCFAIVGGGGGEGREEVLVATAEHLGTADSVQLLELPVDQEVASVGVADVDHRADLVDDVEQLGGAVGAPGDIAPRSAAARRSASSLSKHRAAAGTRRRGRGCGQR